VTDDSVLEESAGTALGQIDVLIDHHDVTGHDFLAHRAHGGQAHQVGGAELFEGADVGAIVDLMRRQLMISAVPRQKEQARFTELPEHDLGARCAIRGRHLALRDMLEPGHLVDTAAADDAEHVCHSCWLTRLG
jgi:hypothetical protein